MARTTRSTATVQEKDKSVETTTTVLPPSRSKSKSKKRKRDSVVDYEDQPVTKAVRHDTGVDEDQQEEKANLDGIHVQPLPPSADAFLDPSNAQQILDILEMVDTQGLLDRVFPLFTESSEPTSARSCSFRTLLQEPSKHPLRALRAAVQHLFPISSHSRSRSSTPGAQQLRFCNLALSLLDEVSKSSIPISLDIDSLPFSVDHDPSSSPVKRRKYTLMQKLPSGEWWTSLNSDITFSQQETELREVGTGHSELVSVLPTPSTSSLPLDQPTLSSFVSKKASTSTKLHPAKHRFVSRGSFLDYGPFASFSPTFEQDGREVGRIGLGEVLLAERRNKEKAKAAETLRRKRLNEIHDQDVVMEDEAHSALQAGERTTNSDDWEASKGLLTREQIDSIKAALENLDLEVSVHELLDRNAKALVRLEELQMQRLGDKTGFRPVEIGSEEWDTAQAIKGSLAILMSLRPRSSMNESLIPPSPVLRRLQLTLPLDASPGWNGNLPAARPTALRDDTTIHLKAGALSAVVDSPITNRAGPSKPSVPTTPYSAYPTTNYTATIPYPTTTSYGTYTPNQGNYYQNYGTATTGYSSQPYSSPWYSNYPQSQSNSGRATPQPSVTTTVPVSNQSTVYQAPQPQRAVANTVLTSSTATKSHLGWSGTGGITSYPLTLPAHVRNSVTGSTISQPGTPGVYHQTLR